MLLLAALSACAIPALAPAAAAETVKAGSATFAAAPPADSLAEPGLGAAALPGGDAATAPDSVAAQDRAPAAVARPDAVRRVPPAPGAFSTPRWVMLRSAVFPGWGQAHNGQWWKAGVVAAVEVGLAYRIYDDNRALDDLSRQAAAAEAAGDAELQNALALRYNDRLDTMVARQWLLAGVIVYALLDAYVDAHFRGFDVEFETDPALPEDAPAASGVRAGLRWSF